MRSTALRPLVYALLGDPPPVRVAFWDGGALGPPDAPGTIVVRSPDALRRMMWAPGEVGLSRAYVAGDLDVEGDIYAAISALRTIGRVDVRNGLRATPAAIGAARALGVLGPPLPPPPEEARPRGRKHSKRRDATAVTHHYDVGNEFYRLVLGPSLTYSCAYYAEDDVDLTAAQSAKHELICRKLGLHDRTDQRLLDIGCGWGTLAIHAAAHHGARVVGVTISDQQAALARERVEAAGLSDRVEIRLQDYRDLVGERFDAVSSVGMFEHVGTERMAEYFRVVRRVLGPHGRFLNHAISSVGGSRLPSHSFIYRYVFPDGELVDVGQIVLAMQTAGFEVRDVESLREHYARTLRAWVANLEAGWERAVEVVGPARARIWRLYMAGSAIGFEDGGNGLHQVLGVLPDARGGVAMPATREEFRPPAAAYRTPISSSTSSTAATMPAVKGPNSA